MSIEDDRRFQEAKWHQYEETRRLNDSVTKLLVEIGRIDVRAQERHDVTTQTIHSLRQTMEAFVPRREIDQREQVTHRRMDDLETGHDALVAKHDQLRQDHQLSSERQARIIGYATMAGTGIGGLASFLLRKLGIIS